MALGAVGVVLIISARTGETLIHPDRGWRFLEVPGNTERHASENQGIGPALEPLAFPATDGVRIAGWFLAHPRPVGTVLLLHGFGTNHFGLTHLAYDLREHGLQSLLIDFRGHGASEGEATTLGLREQQDALGALAYLRSRPDLDADRIGVYGVSMGGATALLTIEDGLGVRALVTDCAFATLRGAIDHGFRRIAGLPPSIFRAPTVWFASRFAGERRDAVLAAVQPLARMRRTAVVPPAAHSRHGRRRGLRAGRLPTLRGRRGTQRPLDRARCGPRPVPRHSGRGLRGTSGRLLCGRVRPLLSMRTRAGGGQAAALRPDE